MAVEPGDAQFVSKLDEASKRKAKEELHELNDKDRELAVQSLRQWVLQQKWLKSPTDFAFLLRFIRGKKYSQLLAREQITNYWTARTQSPELFGNIDPFDKILVEILKSGIYIVPKQRDKHGRHVMWQRFSAIDVGHVKKWGFANVYKAGTMIFDWLNRDESIQVNGLVVIIDCSDLTMSKMMSIWNPEYEKKMSSFFQDALPGRIKGIHFYNEPTFFDAMYALFAPFLKQKMKDRIRLHGRSLTKLYDQLGEAVMPDEYLPDDYGGPSAGPIDKIVDEMISNVQTPEFVEYIKEHSSNKYGVDTKMRKAEPDAPVASFRKLNVD